jgi:hypothetical protein
MIRRIFLDLDDVLNCFTPYVLNALGCPVSPTEYGQHLGYGWDFIPKINSLHPEKKFSTHGFWQNVSREMWSWIPRSPEFITLLELSVDAVGKENVFILTRPIDYPDSLAGKMEWIQRFCPKWMHDQYIICKQKYLLAMSDSLLVDDCELNIHEFQNAGGNAIAMPRPWNRLRDVADNHKHLENMFHAICWK